MDWGLGLIPDSKQYGDDVPYAYGRLCSRRTFGHSGYRSSTAFADPEHGLAVALAFNGLPADADHEARIRAVVEGIYGDSGAGDAGSSVRLRILTLAKTKLDCQTWKPASTDSAA